MPRLIGRAGGHEWLAIAAAIATFGWVCSSNAAEPAVQPRIIVQNGHAAEISAAAWTKDGQFLLTGSTDGQLLLWDLAGRIVNRITLQPSLTRSVVEKIMLAPDGRGAEIDEINFRDLWNNGVASEVKRRRYSVKFGDTQVTLGEETPVEVPWPADAFFEKSLELKNSLIKRRDWPVSARGWRLAPVNGQLAMVPPGAGADPVILKGALGQDPDQGDAALEAKAKRFDIANERISLNADISAENGRNCGWDESQPCARRKPQLPMFDDTAEQRERDTRVRGRPLLSPEGKYLAWIDRVDSQAAGWTIRILDIERGKSGSIGLKSRPSDAQIGWTGAATLMVRDERGNVDIDVAELRVAPAQDNACFLPSSGELHLDTSIPCKAAPPVTDAKRALTPRLVNGLVHVNNATSGRYFCSAFLEETEIMAAAFAFASRDGRTILLQSASGAIGVSEIGQRLDRPDCPDAADCKAPPSRTAQMKKWGCGGNNFGGVFPFASAMPGRLGIHPAYPLAWIEQRGGRLDFLRFDNVRNGPPLFSLYRLPGGRFFAIDPAGRYDTNLPPDSDAVRWLMLDAPLQSLPPQTFMRDYYQPGLMRRLMECAASSSGECSDKFPALRPLASLNRVLPKVRIAGVRQGKTPTQAIVSVEVADGIDPEAPNGKTRTGVYDVRLFRNNRLVRTTPDPGFEYLKQRQTVLKQGAGEPGKQRLDLVAQKMRQDATTWRRLTQIRPDAKGGYPVLDFVVDLPSAAGTEKSIFSAYAFNEDRVKSDTAQIVYHRPAAPPQRPRAFVVTIGVDAYEVPRLDLQFAASDAELMANRLAAIPGYDVRRVKLTGTRSANGPMTRVSRKAIEAVLGSFAGGDTAAAADYLRANGFDPSQLDRVRPDDIVIVSFSGHGWADSQGNFYLLPADAKWAEGSPAPDASTLFSSDDLFVYLSAIPAAEITLVIDACHSAASVDAGNFKPGPMGDAGLGQLAFDKGIRILAATQSDDVAFEDPVLRQGRLTYALAGEGIMASGGKADGNGDGRIVLEEWLTYAAKRMPSLADDAQLRRFATGARGWVRADAATAKPRNQEPSLFDFNSSPSRVILRESVGP